MIPKGKRIVEGKFSDFPTTNNIMEVESLIRGVEELKKLKFDDITELDIVSDSEYVILALQSRLEEWIENGWRNKSGKEPANSDLMRKLLKTKRFLENQKILSKVRLGKRSHW